MTLVVQNTLDPTLYNSLATLTGSQIIANKTLKVVKEPVTIAGVAPTSTTNFDVATQSIVVYNTATQNFILNVRGDSSTDLNSLLNVGESVGITLFVPNGLVPYYLSNVTVDGVAGTRTIQYQNATPIAAGNASCTDVYVVYLIKTAVNTWSVYISQTKYA
jgi:filamentous hemagglutinin family protein